MQGKENCMIQVETIKNRFKVNKLFLFITFNSFFHRIIKYEKIIFLNIFSLACFLETKHSHSEFSYEYSFVLLLVLLSLSSAVVKDLKYADSHEWVKFDGKSAVVGITDHAQDHLGDVVYVELPEAGTTVTQGSSFGAVESVKATSDINSPVSGKVVEVNEELSSSPGLVSP